MKFTGQNSLADSFGLSPRITMRVARAQSSGTHVLAGVRLGMILVGMALAISSPSSAQHGGGGHGGGMGGLSNTSTGRPDGVDEKDPLKLFHEAMEVQATSDQAAAFRMIVKNTEAASVQLTSLQKETEAPRLASRSAELKQALDKVQIETKNFLDAMTAKQKLGLKETISKLAKEGSDLAEQEKMLDANGGDREHVARAENLAKALTSFQNQQVTLALEMGIVPSDAEEPAFRIPFKTATEVGGQRIGVTSTAAISRRGPESGQNLYRIRLTTDLSDLQPNLTAALSPQVDYADRCGERVSLEDATLTASSPSSVVLAQFYAERWICMASSAPPNEVAQGRGSAEVKVTPVIGDNGEIEMKTELGRVDADRFLAEMLRTGSLGSTLREKVAATLLRAFQSADFKETLPAAASGSAKPEAVRFEATLDGGVAVIVEGEMRISDEQAKLLGDQLKERMSSQVGH